MHHFSLSKFLPHFPPLCRVARVANADEALGTRCFVNVMRHLLGNIGVAVRVILVSADLLVLTLALLHELGEDGVIVLGDGLGCHLHGAVAVGFLDVGRDLLNRGLQHLDTKGLVQALAGQDVQRRGHKLDLDLVLGGVVGLGGTEGRLDGVNSVIAEAGDFDIGTDLSGVGGKLLANVILELLLHGLRGELDIVPDIGVAAEP